MFALKCKNLHLLKSLQRIHILYIIKLCVGLVFAHFALGKVREIKFERI